MKRKEPTEDDFKLKITLWSPWFIQKNVSVERVEANLRESVRGQ